ncbi:MAG: hypothetical protein SV062_05710 [Thermodesulfobacteriota bacterium]|nr:hypothetical protein [Thermodesulfobacteriota bacterium]
MIKGLNQILNNTPLIEKTQNLEQQGQKLSYRHNFFEFQKQTKRQREKAIKGFPPFKILINDPKEKEENKKERKKTERDLLDETEKGEKFSTLEIEPKKMKMIDVII